MVLTNTFNAEDYFDGFITGASLKVIMETKYTHLDIVFGTIFLTGTYSNGGGVFAGISPRSRGRHVGVTSEFALGAFSFKDFVGSFNATVFDKKASHGLGGLASIGFYVKFGRFGLSPSVNAVYSGGSEASFLHYGFTIPLTLRITD